MGESRSSAILDVARLSGVVTVEALVRRFDVTPQTIRKDLNELCANGLLERVHGGARLSAGVENMSYEARRVIAAAPKRAIGEAVAGLIPDNASLFINIGTTTEAVAHALVQHRQLMVITNNINVASLLRLGERNQVIIAGGEVRCSDGGVVGQAAVDFISQFKVDFAVIGASAIDTDGTLLDFDYREVRVAQAIINNARHVMLAADVTKHERTAPVRIGHVSQVQTFVTDRCPDDAFRQVLADLDIRNVETSRQMDSACADGSGSHIA